MEESLTKKIKTDNHEILRIKSYSSIISQPFVLQANTFLAYFYKFLDISEYGIIIPIELTPVPDTLIYLKRLDLRTRELLSLKTFQHVF